MQLAGGMNASDCSRGVARSEAVWELLEPRIVADDDDDANASATREPSGAQGSYPSQ